MRRTTSFLALLTSLAVGMLLAGCGAPPESAVTATATARAVAGPTNTVRPATEEDRRLVIRALGTMLDLESYHAEGTLLFNGERSTVRIEYFFGAPDRLLRRAPGTGRNAEVLYTGGKAYLQEEGRWVEEPDGGLALKAPGVNSPKRLLAADFREAGDTPESFVTGFVLTDPGIGAALNGVQTRRLDLERGSRSDNKDGTWRRISFWIDPLTGYIHKAEHRWIYRFDLDFLAGMPVPGTPVPTAEPPLEYGSVMVFTRHNDASLIVPSLAEVRTATRAPAPRTATPVRVARPATSEDLDTLARSFRAMSGLSSYHAVHETRIQTGGFDEAAETYKTAYEVVWKAPESIYLKGALMGREIEVVAHGDRGYARQDDAWVEQSSRELYKKLNWGVAGELGSEAEKLSPYEVLRQHGGAWSDTNDLQTMLNAGAVVEAYGGEETLDGVEVRRYRIITDMGRWGEEITRRTPDANPFPTPAVAIEYNTTFLIAPDTGFMHQAIVSFSPGSRQTDTPEATGLPETYAVTTFSRHNDPTLEVPTP